MIKEAHDSAQVEKPDFQLDTVLPQDVTGHLDQELDDHLFNENPNVKTMIFGSLLIRKIDTNLKEAKNKCIKVLKQISNPMVPKTPTRPWKTIKTLLL